MKKYSKYIITFVVGLLIGLVVFVIKDAFVLEDSKKIIAVLIDASFVPGILMVCFGLLVVSANGGTFDMLVFGTRQFFNLFRKKFNRETRNLNTNIEQVNLKYIECSTQSSRIHTVLKYTWNILQGSSYASLQKCLKN